MSASVVAERDNNDCVSCSFCGKKYKASSVGEWVGSEVIVCCHHCSINTLPMLLADSVCTNAHRDGCRVHATEQFINIFMKNFYRALAIRLTRRKEDEA